MDGTMDDGPYEVLGVARDASATEVRKAYFRLVRLHTPEDAPEEFARISAAYQVLSDPEARRRLDAAQTIPVASRMALDDAARHLEQQPTEAARRARVILGRPDQPDLVKVAAAAICVEAGEPTAAIPVLADIVKRAPENVGAVCRLSEAYAQKRQFATAGKVVRAALQRDPRNVELYVALSRVYRAAGKPKRADDTLLEAIEIAGATDTASLPLHFLRLPVLAEQNRWDEMICVGKRIRRGIPEDDEDLKHHVVGRYVEGGFASLAGRAYALGGFLLERAQEIAPSDDLRKKCDEVAPWALAQRQARAALTRTEVPDWIKALLVAMLGDPVDEEGFNEIVASAFAAYARQPKTAAVQWKRFEKDFPAAADCVRELRDRIAADVKARGWRTQPATYSTTNPRDRGRKRETSGLSVAAMVLIAVAGLGVRTCAKSRPDPPRRPSIPAYAPEYPRDFAAPRPDDPSLEELRRELERMRTRNVGDEGEVDIDEIVDRILRDSEERRGRRRRR